MSDAGSVLWALLMALLSIITVIGNLAVLLSYYLDKNIRHPSNYFIFSLAVSDLSRKRLHPKRSNGVSSCNPVWIFASPTWTVAYTAASSRFDAVISIQKVPKLGANELVRCAGGRTRFAAAIQRTSRVGGTHKLPSRLRRQTDFVI
ncbi:hypothetical protein NECAME_13059 [Necator americanus]|uniref:G-protein coupled receptors family 1 profile domain-containing protein n=1 Tax=Necator americanus TaxID=51031 RepID=W2SXH4_NECAM|nr:hypothetical protein NECAME_13059 [Necator americanus]ETN74315.1 hypothetical protein NECAME_13059 [Necator americanus]